MNEVINGVDLGAWCSAVLYVWRRMTIVFFLLIYRFRSSHATPSLITAHGIREDYRRVEQCHARLPRRSSKLS